MDTVASHHTKGATALAGVGVCEDTILLSKGRKVNGGKTKTNKKEQEKVRDEWKEGFGQHWNKTRSSGGVSGTSVSRLLRSCLCCCIPFEP